MNSSFRSFVLFIVFTSFDMGLGKKVVCYYGTWATYRPGNGKFDVEDINPNLCTHLIYTFAGLETDGSVKSLDAYLDFDRDGGLRTPEAAKFMTNVMNCILGYFEKFNALKKNNAKLQTFLAVGGYNEGSAKYSNMAADPNQRAKFIQSSIDLIIKYNFDGLDLDWEYPNQRDTTHGQADVDNFTNLLKELKAALSKQNLGLSVAVAAVKSSASLSYDVVGVAQNVDFINIMAYDLSGSWESRTGHNAPLYRGEGDENVPEGQLLTVDAAVKYWLGQGCPPDKLVLGLPLYGRTFTLTDASNAGVRAPASGPGNPGPYTQEPGMMGYNEICEKFKTESWIKKQDQSAKVPYAVKGNTWLSYDDPESVATKVSFAVANNLAGVMVWSIETDDFKGICGENYPLLRSINKVLGNSDGTTTTTTTESASTVTTTTLSTSTAPGSTTTTYSSPDTTTTTSATTTSTTPTSTTSTTPTTTTTTTTTTNTPTQSPNSICKEEGVTSNPADCSSFFYCHNSPNGVYVPVVMNCPSGTLWDSSISTCNYASEVICKL